MCRSSAQSIGFLLLLWIGIFIPVAGDQVSHLVGSHDLGGIFHGGLDDGDSDDTALSQDKGAAEHSGSFASADLTDFTVAPQPPQVSALGNALIAPRIAAAFASRALPPEERPPIALTA